MSGLCAGIARDPVQHGLQFGDEVGGGEHEGEAGDQWPFSSRVRLTDAEAQHQASTHRQAIPIARSRA
jgi:hypothetical protein